MANNTKNTNKTKPEDIDINKDDNNVDVNTGDNNKGEEDVVDKKVVKEKEIKEPTALEQKLNDLSEVVNNLLKENKELKDKVEYVSDKGRLDRFNGKEAKPLLPTAGVSKLNGKYIQSWKTIENIADIVDGRIYEKQIIEVTYTDDTTESMNLINFYRNKEKVIGEVIRKFNDRENNDVETWVIQLSDGQEIKLSINFVN